MLKITPEEVNVIARYVNDLTGIVLDQSKSYLMESRLSPIAEEIGCENYSELYFKAKNDLRRQIQNRIIDAITTNETFFFRDTSPFELLRYKVFPDVFDQIIDAGPMRNLNIWSSACSTGQEVYSTAIILKELLPDIDKWKIRLLGTDISDAAIAQASYGQYNSTEISRGLKQDQLIKYFNQNGSFWRIKDEIRYMASFKKQNLLETFTNLEKYDIILCRNVAIYFSQENRRTMFERIASQLKPNGILIIGASESLIGISERFERKDYMRSVFYKLKG